MAPESLDLLHTAGLCEDTEARRICRDTLMVPRCSSVDRRLLARTATFTCSTRAGRKEWRREGSGGEEHDAEV